MSGKRFPPESPGTHGPHEAHEAREAHEAHDPYGEVARFLREQPPYEIPRRARPPAVPGLIAHTVLGGRVIRRLD